MRTLRLIGCRSSSMSPSLMFDRQRTAALDTFARSEPRGSAFSKGKTLAYPSDYDLRHGLNVVGSYRIGDKSVEQAPAPRHLCGQRLTGSDDGRRGHVERVRRAGPGLDADGLWLLVIDDPVGAVRFDREL